MDYMTHELPVEPGGHRVAERLDVPDCRTDVARYVCLSCGMASNVVSLFARVRCDRMRRHGDQRVTSP